MSFRKLDIDSILATAPLGTEGGEGEDGAGDGQAFVEELDVGGGGPNSLAEAQSALSSKSNQVKSALAKGSLRDALLLALAGIPTHKDYALIKAKHLSCVMDVLGVAKSADLPNLIKAVVETSTSITPGYETVDLTLLLKCVYAGMASPESFPSASLLVWQEKIIEVTGLAGIVRVLTDRRSFV